MENKKIINVPLDKYYYDITMKEFTPNQLLEMGYMVTLEDKFKQLKKGSKNERR